MSKLEQIQAHIAANEAFRISDARGPEPATAGEELQRYHAWLTDQKAWMEQKPPQDPEELRGHRGLTIFSIYMNQAFQDYLRGRNREYFENTVAGHLGSATGCLRVPPEVAVPLIRHYGIWVDDELDDTAVALSELGIRARLKRDEREDLRKDLEELRRTDLTEARQAGLLFQQAKQEKTALKRKALALLGEDYRDITTRQGMDLLQKRIDQLIGKIYARAEEIGRHRLEHPGEREYRKRLRRYIRQKQTEVEQLETCRRQLREAQSMKSGAEELRQREARRAELAFGQLNQRFRSLNQQVVDASIELRTDISRLEADIARKKGELEGLIQLIPALHEQLETESGFLEKLRDYRSSEMRTELERSVGELKQRIEATNRHHEQVARDLAFLDARYSAARDCIGQELESHEELLAMRDAARDELAWIKKLPKADKALNVYCSAFGFNFNVLLQIGHLIGGAGGGAAGGTATAAVSGLQGFFAMGGGGPGLLAGALEGGAAGAVLSQCKPYDTGSFALSLKLGLSLGLPGDWGAKIGLALVYDAGINIQDDRRFRASNTLTVQATGKARLPDLFEAAITADLYKDATTFVFKDHYQWAAWLAQKWANIFAWARACTLYQRAGNRLDQPTPQDLANIRELALITLTENPKLRELLTRAAKFMEEPILRVEQKDLLAGGSAEVSFVEGVFGAGLEGERPGEPRYIRLEYDPHTGRIREMRKEGRNWAAGGSLTALVSVGLNRSSTQRHSNPDNNGEALNITISYPGLKHETQWLDTPKSEAPATRFGDWIETHLKPIAETLSKASPNWQSFSGPLKTTEFTSLATTLSLADFEINFVRSDLRNGKSAWCLQYWRPIFSSGTEVSRSVPLHAGINLDLGGSLSLARTYKEQLGTNTLTYVRLVYHGFMNRTPPDFAGDAENTRPREAWGRTLWDEYARAHKKQLYRLCRNIGTDGSWVNGEAKDLTGHEALISACKKLPSSFGDSAFDSARKALDAFLETARKADYEKDCREGWKEVEISEFQWSINPYQLAMEVSRSRSSAYKLDKAAQGLRAERRGLAEQIAGDRDDGKKQAGEDTSHWIPDAQAPRCLSCGTRFGLVTRRHHCRNCGGVFCDKCSSKRRAVPGRGFHSPARVCDACYGILGGRSASPARTPDSSLLKPAPGLHNSTTSKKDLLHPDSKPPEKSGLLAKGSGPSFSDKPSGTLNYTLTAGHQRLLHDNGRREKPVAADGNCLYASLIAMGLFGGPPVTREKIMGFRGHISRELRENKIAVDDLYLEGSKGEIATEIAKSGHYSGEAGEYAPEFISRSQHVKLLIYNEDGSTTPVGPDDQPWPTYHLIRFTRPAKHYHATAPL
jgi:hypothetical protein